MIVIAEQTDGTIVPMTVENGQMIKVAGKVKGKYIAEEFIPANMERYYNIEELMKFVTGLGYSMDDIQYKKGKVGKSDVCAFLRSHWQEWFSEDEQDCYRFHGSLN